MSVLTLPSRRLDGGSPPGRRQHTHRNWNSESNKLKEKRNQLATLLAEEINLGCGLPILSILHGRNLTSDLPGLGRGRVLATPPSLTPKVNVVPPLSPPNSMLHGWCQKYRKTFPDDSDQHTHQH